MRGPLDHPDTKCIKTGLDIIFSDGEVHRGDMYRIGEPDSVLFAVRFNREECAHRLDMKSIRLCASPKYNKTLPVDTFGFALEDVVEISPALLTFLEVWEPRSPLTQAFK